MDKLILTITGSRSIESKKCVWKCLDDWVREKELDVANLTLRSGNAVGVDRSAEEWAKNHDVAVVTFKPDWSIGKHAGMLRNEKMIEGSDYVVAVWDGESRGTKHAIKFARSLKIDTTVYKSENSLFPL